MKRGGVLAFVGLGLAPEDIPIRALKFLKNCDEIYLENYTSLIPGLTAQNVSSLIGKDVTPVSRRDLEEENGDKLIKAAMEGKVVALLVPGDPFVATTHVAIRLRAEKLGVRTVVYNAPSILTAVIGATGLQPYKFGRIVTIVYPEEKYGFFPKTPYEVLRDNLARGLHTLFLLDLKLEQGLAMTVGEAARLLLEMEQRIGEGVLNDNTLGVGLARIGTSNARVLAATLSELASVDLGPPPHSLVIPGKLHPLEAEALIILCGAQEEVVRRWNLRFRKELEST